MTFVDWADLVRWKMINQTLGLPFDEPQETYSTSEHLYHDLGIPHGTKGRIVDPTPVAKEDRKPAQNRDGQGRNSQRRGGEKPRAETVRSDKGRGEGQSQPRQRNRNRNRTRSGAPVKNAD